MKNAANCASTCEWIIIQKNLWCKIFYDHSFLYSD